MSVALSMEGSFGFALQTDKGSFVEPNVWLPLLSAENGRGDTIQYRKNYVMPDMADGKEFQTNYYSAGEWAEGTATCPVVPGSVSGLFSWIQDRDAENQGRWASVLIDCINEVKKITDTKVRKATFDLTRGEAVTCKLDVCGLAMESGDTPSPAMPVVAPYVFREVSLQIASDGQSLAADAHCESISIEIDNMVEDAEDGLRLVESGAPQHLYNLAGLRCTGKFSRDFVDSAIYGDFVNGAEAALVIALARGATTATISLPRVLYNSSDLGLPGSHSERIVEGVSFVALGSADGLTAPVVLA